MTPGLRDPRRALEALCGAIAAVALFGIMALTLADVAGRKLFDTSVPGSLEVTELLMVAVIFAALPLVSLHGEHVVFDSLDPVVPAARLRRLQHALVDGLCSALLAGLAWLTWSMAGQMAGFGDTTAQLKLPLGPFVYLMSVLIGVTALVHAMLVLRPVRHHHAGVADDDDAVAPGAPLEGAVSEALIGFAGVFVLALLRVPLAFAMGIVGFAGLGLLRGWSPTMANAAQVVYDTGFAYTLSVVPLFILMGNFVARAGLAHELFRVAYAFIGHLRGGLAHATVIACAGFGAICGSSIATAATMSKVAYPPMKRLGYADYLSTGVIAAGGTLGIMIPPSTIMVIYGIVTETHIGKLFAAGVLPGLLCAALLMAAVAWITLRDPAAGPAGERTGWPGRLAALRSIWGVVLLVVLVLGGIYGGVFTATEGAGIGASGAFFFALARGALSLKILSQVLVESARTTAMLFTILIAAMLFSSFVNFTTMPGDLKDAILKIGLPPLAVVGAMMLIYVLLGTIMEELSMVLLTIPVFFPIVTGLGFDPVWFGVLIVLVVQIGLISPPVGMNLFVLNALLKDVGLGQIFRGVWLFVAALVVALVVVLEFQPIALWLPGFMK